jgi:uncharacterized protein
MLPADPLFYVIASIAVILVGIAKGGFSGLGAASMPLLVLVMDPIRAAAVLLPILMAQDVVGIWAFRKSFDVPTLKLMVPSALVGIFLGWLLASAVPSDGVRGLVGLIALLFGANRLLATIGKGVKLSGPLPNWLGAFWGGVSGFTSQVAHAGGPPFQVWTLTRNFPQLIYGQFTPENMQLTLVFLPLAVLSTMAGVVLIKRISPERFQLVINVMMVLVGAELLRDTFW